jgi:hypothetical protein
MRRPPDLRRTCGPDGKRIVTASDDKTARLWEIFPNTQAYVSHAHDVMPRCLSNAARIGAGLAKQVCKVRSVAHQPANFGKFAKGIDCRHRVTCRQCGQLHRTVSEQRVGTDQQCVGSVLHGVAECRADIAIGCGGEDFELLSHGRSSRLHVGDHGLNLRIAGIDRERKARISVQELM